MGIAFYYKNTEFFKYILEVSFFINPPQNDQIWIFLNILKQ